MKCKVALFLSIALLLSFVFVISSSAEPTTTPPSDLTGYTVSLPDGWSAPSAYGQFNVTGTFLRSSSSGTVNTWHFFNSDDPNFLVGYDQRNSTSSNIVWFAGVASGGSRAYLGYTPDFPLTFTITGGEDADNPSLIQWLADNNATFDIGSSPEPEPELSPVAGGFYAYDIKPSQMPSIEPYVDGNTLVYPVPAGSKLYLNEAYNVNRGTEIPIQGIVIQFVNILDSNNYHIKVGVWFSDDAGFVPENVFTIVCTEGTFTKVNRFSFSRFYFSETVNFDEWGYQFFNAVFVPSDQPVPIFDGSPIAYIISSINDALRTDIFGTYSIMDIVTIFVSLSLLIWVLKMLAGG